ncbi:MAG: hypothetical protein KatS3mg109_2161 [Pirellulaceae bacterium]|nr:MAG: hypothetical protein KatS3mg109_2161 [Pirellulaceae bacterium]
MIVAMVRIYKDKNVAELTKTETDSGYALRVSRYDGALVGEFTGNVSIAISEALSGAALVEFVDEEMSWVGDSWLVIKDDTAVTKEWTIFQNGKFVEYLNQSELVAEIRRVLDL